MELATRAMEFASRAASNNTVKNRLFRSLCIQSSMRQTIWNWKQKLYTDAEADKKPIVPLSKLKSIYGEVPTLPQSAGTTEKKDGKASASKIII